jgi:ribose transport system ATP-binding protein
MSAVPETPPRLEMRGVKKSFGPTRALDGVDLSVAPGQVLSLVGENGAGKSTLMKVLSGAHAPDEGEMFLDGERYQPSGPLDARACGVAMIYQELSLATHLSITENILLGIEKTKGPFLDWNAMEAEAVTALEAVGLGHLSPRTRVRTLSIAQQQLVEIARAVALNCRVLVLDEPTSSLTKKDIETLFTLVRSLSAQGISVIYISHFMEEVTAISSRILVLRDGRTVGQGKTGDLEVPEIISMMVGREVDDLYPRSVRDPGEPFLHIRELSGKQGLPQQAGITVRRGEIHGISGLVGAGRTEFMRCIFGLDEVEQGEITVGAWQGPATPRQRWGQQVGMVSENRKEEGLAVNLSIAENLTLPKLKGLGPWRLVTPERQAAACQPWISRLQIKCASADQKVSGLSGGNQQKVAIARLLHAEVDLLLLDEPTRGIDVGSKAQIYQLIDELAKGDAEAGRASRAILMISSYLPELLGTCDRITVMCKGEVVETRPTEDWNEHQLMEAAIGQEATL